MKVGVTEFAAGDCMRGLNTPSPAQGGIFRARVFNLPNVARRPEHSVVIEGSLQHVNFSPRCETQMIGGSDRLKRATAVRDRQRSIRVRQCPEGSRVSYAIQRQHAKSEIADFLSLMGNPQFGVSLPAFFVDNKED